MCKRCMVKVICPHINVESNINKNKEFKHNLQQNRHINKTKFKKQELQ